MALDNCTGGGDDAMAAEEVTGIGSVGNIFEGGLSGDNMTPEYKDDQQWQRWKCHYYYRSIHYGAASLALHNSQENCSQPHIG